MDVIRKTLEVIRQLVNQYMQNLDRRGDDWVALTNAVNQDGTVNDSAQDKIVMGLYNITRETVISTYAPARPGADAFAIVQPPLYIDLHIVFMANFSGRNYSDGLAAISRLIAYFQQTPWFSQANAPDLDPEIDKITMEFANLTPSEVNHVVGMLGVNYLPSVFYKLRMLPFASTAMQARTYPARGGSVSEAPDAPVAS